MGTEQAATDAGKALYLRVSVTEACAARCPYCQPEHQIAKGPSLSVAQLVRLMERLVAHGVARARLTGGEPLLRRDIGEIVSSLSALPGLREVAMTTSGELLAPRAVELHRQGLARVNVHLDSLRADRFERLTGRPLLADVLEGIDQAIAAGMPVKLNTVLMKGINDDELVDFCRFGRERGVTVRFIELMNTGPARGFVARHFMSTAEARERIERHHRLVRRFESRGASPAEELLVDGGPSRIGFIAPETAPFCGPCNRLRLSANGRLVRCLFETVGVDLTPALASGDAQVLDRAIAKAIAGKRSHHPGVAQTEPVDFSMARIGG